MTQSSPNSMNFVDGDGSTDAAATDHDATFDLAGSHGLREWYDKVRIVVRGIKRRGTEIDHFVSSLAQPPDQKLLHLETAVVSRQCYLHQVASSPFDGRALVNRHY